MFNLQQYFFYLFSDKSLEDYVVFLARKVFISVHFSVDSYKQEMRSSLAEKPQMKITSFRDKNIDL